MRIAQYKDVVVNARFDSGLFHGFDVMVLDHTRYAPRGLDEYLSKDQIDNLATILAAAAEGIIRVSKGRVSDE